MKLKLYLIPVLILIIIFGGIALSKSFGLWQTYTQKTPAKFESGAFQGENDPYDIRGSYTFQDIEINFDVSVKLLAEAFPISDDNFETNKAKDVEDYYGEMNLPYEIGTGSVKYFVALYNGLPFDGEEALPDTAISVLERDAKIEPDTMIGLQTDDVYAELSSEEMMHTELNEGEFAITGDTTVKDTLNQGIIFEDLEAIIGNIDDENSSIKDIAQRNGFAFGEVKDTLNELLQ